VKAILIINLTAIALLVSCSGGPPQTKEAVQAGVVKYISKRSDMTMSSMNVEVTAVSFKPEGAEATVAFSAKGSPGGSGSMTMNYQLEPKGKEWVVKSRRDTGGGANPHGGAAMDGGAEGAMPPMPAMPQGHPPVEKKQ
jgi:hypothetical protein